MNRNQIKLYRLAAFSVFLANTLLELVFGAILSLAIAAPVMFVVKFAFNLEYLEAYTLALKWLCMLAITIAIIKNTYSSIKRWLDFKKLAPKWANWGYNYCASYEQTFEIILHKNTKRLNLHTWEKEDLSDFKMKMGLKKMTKIFVDTDRDMRKEKDKKNRK